MLDFLAASRPRQDMGRIVGKIMGRRIRLASDTSLKQWAAIAAIAIIGGCSWFSDEPTPPPAPVEKPTTVGTTGTIPDVNTVPTEAPKPTITNVDQAQQGLGADSSNAQYGDQLTMPSATAPRPEAPAPAAPAEAPAAEPTPAAPAPEPASQVVPAAPAAQQPQVAQAPLEAAAPAAPAPEAMAPMAGTVAAPQVGAGGVIYQPLTGTPQQGSMPFQPSGDLNLASTSRNTGKAVTVDYSAIGSGGSVGYASAGGYTNTPRFPYGNPAQAMYRSPYGLAPYGSNGVIVNNGVPVYGAYPYAYGQPTGMVYFRNGSASLSGDDRRTLRQIAETQKAYGGVIRVVAHASQHTGNMNINLQDVTNRRMSIARANAVAHALVKYGVQPSLVQIAAAGDDQPVIYPETMPISEAANRRAEVYLSAY